MEEPKLLLEAPVALQDPCLPLPSLPAHQLLIPLHIARLLLGTSGPLHWLVIRWAHPSLLHVFAEISLGGVSDHCVKSKPPPQCSFPAVLFC